MKFETFLLRAGTGEINVVNFIESNVDRRLKKIASFFSVLDQKSYLVKVHKATFQRKQDTILSFTTARNAIVT